MDEALNNLSQAISGASIAMLKLKAAHTGMRVHSNKKALKAIDNAIEAMRDVISETGLALSHIVEDIS